MKDESLSGTVYQKSYKKAFEYYFGPKGQMRAGGDGIFGVQQTIDGELLRWLLHVLL